MPKSTGRQWCLKHFASSSRWMVCLWFQKVKDFSWKEDLGTSKKILSRDWWGAGVNQQWGKKWVHFPLTGASDYKCNHRWDSRLNKGARTNTISHQLESIWWPKCLAIYEMFLRERLVLVSAGFSKFPCSHQYLQRDEKQHARKRIWSRSAINDCLLQFLKERNSTALLCASLMKTLL